MFISRERDQFIQRYCGEKGGNVRAIPENAADWAKGNDIAEVKVTEDLTGAGEVKPVSYTELDREDIKILGDVTCLMFF